MSNGYAIITVVETLEQSSEMRAFERIAPYYDLLMEGVPYRFWAKYLHSLWSRHKVEPTTVLDLACGTGTLALILAKEGFVVSGVDIARPMLDLAVTKSTNEGLYVDFHCQDAADLNLPNQKFDVVISLFDSLNNILERERLAECFRRVRAQLAPGGLFIFDVNTAYAFKEGMFDQNSHPSDGPLQYNWTSTFDEQHSICTVLMHFSYQQSGGEITSFDEVHYQRAYEKSVLIRMLYDAQFQTVTAYDAYSALPPKKRSDRIFFVASTPKL